MKALRNLHLVFFTTIYIYIYNLIYLYKIGIVLTEDELNGDFREVNFLHMNTCVHFPRLSLCHCASVPQLPS